MILGLAELLLTAQLTVVPPMATHTEAVVDHLIPHDRVEVVETLPVCTDGSGRASSSTSYRTLCMGPD